MLGVKTTYGRAKRGKNKRTVERKGLSNGKKTEKRITSPSPRRGGGGEFPQRYRTTELKIREG